MWNLLVDAPSGEQQLVQVTETGFYFDINLVLWDEREDGPVPEITLGGMVWDEDELVFSQTRMDVHTAALAPKVPSEVTMRQARLALAGAGLLTAVSSAIAALAEPNKTVAAIEWEYSQVVQRNRGLVQAMGTAMGLSSAQLDALFITAATL